MATKKKVTKKVAIKYKRASKKEKGKILDEFCATTDYNRSYAARVLRETARPKRRKGTRKRCIRVTNTDHRRGRKPKYGPDVKRPLETIWAIMDCPCGKRLVAGIPQMVNVLEKFGELELTDEVREKLFLISAATCDRMLEKNRKEIQLKSRSKTKPGSLLKHQIPIRTFADWDDASIGFLEMDLVGHDGGNTRGDYCQSLDATDVCSGWTEIRAVKNRAQKWTFAAIEDMEEGFPFPILGIDSDNGGEFINDQLFRYCEKKEITFTRSRPYRKNDNCYAEQKNYTAVRRNVGYMRYDTPKELEILNELYRVLCPYINFFLPQMRLIEKVRIGSKVQKKYDKPKTPYQRILESDDVDEDTKNNLEQQYETLNPAELKRKILALQDKLYKRAVFKGAGRKGELLDTTQGKQYT